MKLNSGIKLNNGCIVMVPYKKKHVEKYHIWMQSKELQELTASCPLTLEEEHEMQQSWLMDDDKCTFIILENELLSDKNEVDAMIGDCNLFLKSDDEEGTKSAEIEIMIAEPTFRKQKRGWVAILSMLRYGVEALSINQYVAKIGLDNKPSILFFKKLNFYEESISNVFNEVTLKLNVNPNWLSWLYMNTTDYIVSPHLLA